MCQSDERVCSEMGCLKMMEECGINSVNKSHLVRLLSAVLLDLQILLFVVVLLLVDIQMVEVLQILYLFLVRIQNLDNHNSLCDAESICASILIPEQLSEINN